MGKLKKFIVKLDGNKDTYFAGETISGHVKLKLASPIQMVRLIVFAKGKARCTSGDTCKDQVYNNEITLFGSPTSRGNSNVEHPAGKYKYAFSYQLPEQLPSSVIEKNGDIKYNITAQIVLKGLKILTPKEMTVTKPIFIKEVIDANAVDSTVPLQQGLWKMGGFFAKKSGRKEALLLTLHRKVYSPGENIQITIKYRDVVARKMGNIKTRMIKYILFNPKVNGRRHSTKTLITVVNDEKRLTGRVYQKIILIPVPEKMPATNLLTKALKLNYSIHLKIDGYPEAKFPITIGTIPLKTPSAPEEDRQEGIGVFNESNLPEYASQTSLEPTAPPYSEFDEENMEWNQNFNYPGEYVPENEFDLPPSYDEAVEEMGEDYFIVTD